MLEQERAFTKEYIETAFEYLVAVKVNPNLMIFSLGLYVVLKDILQTAYDFSDISQFDKCLNDTHIHLSFWCTAFQKAHLNLLALAKDSNRKLYPVE